MENDKHTVLDLSEVPILSYELVSANAKMAITRFLRKINIAFICNINGDVDTEVSFAFSKTNPHENETLSDIFQNGTMFSMFKEDKNVELEVGIVESNSTQVCFGLIDYNYDSTKRERNIGYNLIIQDFEPNYQQISDLLRLIEKRITTKEEEKDEYQPDRIKYKRPSQL